VSVPSVLGQSPSNAGAVLARAGLTVGTQTSACSTSQVPTGNVTGQNPAVGANVPPNTPVNLVISTGLCASVPNVVGQSASSAVSAITGAGLVANQTTDATCANNAQSGNVDSQNPAAGTQVPSNTTVNISVCQPSSTTTTSSSSTTTTTTTTTTTNGAGAGHGAGGGAAVRG